MTNEEWLALAATACNHAGAEYEKIEIVATWEQQYCANAVYCLDNERYLKIFGPTSERQFHFERAALQKLAEQNEIPAPRIITANERTGSRPYLIMTGVPGSTAENVWDDLPRSNQLAIARELGTITAAIHRLPYDDFAAVEQAFGGRSEHIRAYQPRLTELVKRTESLSTQYRDDMIRFLQIEAQEHLEELTHLTHSELAHNHIYLAKEDRGAKSWTVSGFIDWADAMLGPPEWDVTFLWFWTFSRDQEAMRECLQTLYTDGRPPERFARRCLAAILHTHSGPGLWMEFIDQGGGRSISIERELTDYLFPQELFGPPD
ncbi:MAG: aminoglycoside 3'-phosphotransferase/choline kinase family protein [Chloroflexota bacterium]